MKIIVNCTGRTLYHYCNDQIFAMRTEYQGRTYKLIFKVRIGKKINPPRRRYLIVKKSVRQTIKFGRKREIEK